MRDRFNTWRWKYGAHMLALLLFAAVVWALAAETAHGADRWPRPPAWWLHSSYMTCVRHNESHNGADPRAHGNIYGMQAGWAVAGGRGFAGNASRAEQNYRAWILWRRYGCHEPWGQYDGCC